MDDASSSDCKASSARHHDQEAPAVQRSVSSQSGSGLSQLIPNGNIYQSGREDFFFLPVLLIRNYILVARSESYLPIITDPDPNFLVWDPDIRHNPTTFVTSNRN
jgi:hypothetical protein